MAQTTYAYLATQKNLLLKEKDEAWRKSAVDYYCNMSNRFEPDWERMEENYKLLNNQLDKKEYVHLCKGLGSDEAAFSYVNSYNMTPNIINSLTGEELGRPFSYSVINESPLVANRIERERRMELEKMVTSIFQLEIDKVNTLKQAEQDAQSKNADPSMLEGIKAKIEEKFKKAYKNIPEIKDIFSKYENITTLEEITVSKVMKALENKKNLKLLKNDSFKHALVAGTEAVEVCIETEGCLPEFNIVNPLNMFFEKSPNVKFLHQADYVGYREWMTVSKALEKYGKKLSKEDYEKLIEGNMRNTMGVTGLGAKMHYDKDAPSNWKTNNDLNMFDQAGSFERFQTLNPQLGGAHGFGNMWNSRFSSDIGLSAVPRTQATGRFINIFTVYWKTNRKLGNLKFINEYGEEDETIVDEFFIVPKNAEKIVTKSQNLNKDVIEFAWNDANGNPMSLEWIWVPEVWKGTRIGYDIYVDVGPIVHAYQSLLNPYETKIPIYGVIYNNVNAYCMSVMDVIKPWQKLYYSIMSKLLKLVAQDKGNMAFINGLYFDQRQDVKTTMRILEDNGYIVHNAASLSSGKLGNLASMKIAESIDLSNADKIKYYMEFLSFLEDKIKTASGMSDQRLAQSNPNMTATDNYRETVSSINMSEPMFALHDLLWEHILQGAMEMTISTLSNNTGKIRTLLNDDEKTILDLGMVSLVDNYKLRIGNNSKAFKILKQFEQLTLSLIQNDKADLSTLVDLLRIENLSEFRTKLSDIEKVNQERLEKAQQSEQAHQKEMLQMQLQAKEDEQIAKLDLEFLKESMAYNREEMKAKYNNIAFDSSKDYNHDGVADYMQLEQMQQKINNESRKIDLESRKIETDNEKHIREATLKEKDAELSTQQKANELAVKQRIEAIKAKAKPNPTKK